MESFVTNSAASVDSSSPIRISEEHFTAVPQADLALLQEEFRKSWKAELASLLDICEERLRVDMSHLRLRFETLEIKNKWSPAAFAMIADLRLAVGERDVVAAVDALAHLQSLDPSTLRDVKRRTESILTEPWEAASVATLRRYKPGGENGITTVVLPILNKDLGPVKDAIEEAIGLIRRVEPAIFREIDELITRVKLFQGRLVRGSSNPRTFGAVFFRLAEPKYHQLAYWVEHLVHEVSHHRLELLRVHDPLVLNSPEATYRAPLRTDPRPILGVYHGTFVVARMLRVLRRLCDLESHPIYQERAATLRGNLTVGINTLRAYGKFSRLGEKVFDSLEATAGD